MTPLFTACFAAIGRRAEPFCKRWRAELLDSIKGSWPHLTAELASRQIRMQTVPRPALGEAHDFAQHQWPSVRLDAALKRLALGVIARLGGLEDVDVFLQKIGVWHERELGR